MKNFTTSFLLSLLATFFFTACSNDSSDDAPVAENSTGDYWPTTVDNNWVYAQNGEETSMKIIGIDEINGAKYYKFNQMAAFGSSIAGQASVWIKKNKGDYYIKIGDINIDVNGMKGKITGYEFILFKDYLEANQTWTGSYSTTTSYNIANFPSIVTNVNCTGKILEKNLTLTINGITYKDVIKFSLVQNPSISGQATSEIVTNYWIAKNVGLIKIDNAGSISELKSSVIK
ncbi:hypothetical protein [Flavobacterium aestivum]|uniref:hypothetical protein n=1 Tax=Flavobacterium aestivum TaxID=3003257 RepID=UPI0022856467|nr:hypothetical protein [Flavobacterium aestivum]